MCAAFTPPGGRENYSLYSKKHPQYWSKRIFHLQQGTWTSPNFCVRFSSHGKQRMITLRSTNRKDAATEARDLWRDVEKSGWEAAAHLSKKTARSPKANLDEGPASTVVTFAEFCEVAKTILVNVSPPSFTAYKGALRTIISESSGLQSLKKNGPSVWRNAVDLFDITTLTPSTIQKWIATRLSKNDPRSNSPKRTIRSTTRNAKSLFSKAVLKEIVRVRSIEIPSPFVELQVPRKSTTLYNGSVDLADLIRQARRDLESGNKVAHQAWKILVLCVASGLRRAEVDRLKWSHLDLDHDLLRIVDENGTRPKSDSSVGEVKLDPEISQLMRQWDRKNPDDFVIPSSSHWRSPGCRAGEFFSFLTKWLRNYEAPNRTKPLLKVQKPIHELRKAAGSQVNKLHGLHAARTFLRHSDIQTTSSYYLDGSPQYTVGIGSVLIHKQDEPSVQVALPVGKEPGQFPLR